MNNHTDITVLINDSVYSRMLELELKDCGFSVAVLSAFARDSVRNSDLLIIDPKYLNSIPSKYDDESLILISKSSDKTYSGFTSFIRPILIDKLINCVKNKLDKIHIRSSIKSETDSASAIDELVFDENSGLARYGGNILPLTKREFELLLYLYRNKGIPVSRANAIKNVWCYDYTGDTNIVDVYIRYLREKIDETYNIKLIYTVRNKGYVLK